MGKAITVIHAAEGELASPYVFGAWGGYCTPDYRKKYLSYNPSHTAIRTNCPVLSGRASTCSGCKYDGKRAFDCRGFVHWVFLQAGIKIDGQTVTNQWKGSNWDQQGEIADMPELVCAVFQKKPGVNTFSHTGVYVGDGLIIHCSGEVKAGNLSEAGWTHYAIPKGLYTADEIREAGARPMYIKKGDRGEQVKELQQRLNARGYDCGKADGVFGAKTEAALKAFQEANRLNPDGIAGPETLTALYGDSDAPDSPISGDTSVQVEIPADAAKALYDALKAVIQGV